MKNRAAFALAVLFAINALNFFDRQILGAVGELIRKDWGLSDGALGALGTAFTLLYAFVGVPLGRLTDKTTRTRILSAGVLAWSLLTAASGFARNFTQLFVVRLGVGVGEATCAPAAASLIGDLVPAQQRARAMSVFMLGLPVGIALSYAVSSFIAQTHGWRAAFLLAGLPGLLCAAAALWVPEPARGGAETHNVGTRTRAGSPYALVLRTPTMLWIIVSGALHNFNMYAIGTFLVSYLVRHHGTDLRTAGLFAMAINGLSGIPGLFVGGWLADVMRHRRENGRMLVGACALLLSVPLVFLALRLPARGDATTFALLMGAGCAVMYVYYSTVYSTIQDVIEPSLRGTAMAIYFCAMYLGGASLGPYGTGLISDHFAHQAANAAGIVQYSKQALEPFRAQGLHAAMHVIPVLGALLTGVLFAGAQTVTNDMRRLQEWYAIRE